MRLNSALALCVLAQATAVAAPIAFVQQGWSTEATLRVAFQGHDSDGSGAIELAELTAFDASWISPAGPATAWTLTDIEPDGFLFTNLGNYLIFTRNSAYSLVSTAFEGEALASVFDSVLSPVDRTTTAPTQVPEPAGMLGAGLILLVLGGWRNHPLNKAPAEGKGSGRR